MSGVTFLFGSQTRPNLLARAFIPTSRATASPACLIHTRYIYIYIYIHIPARSKKSVRASPGNAEKYVQAGYISSIR